MSFDRRSLGVQTKHPRTARRVLLVAIVAIACVFLWYRFALDAVDAGSDVRVPFTVGTGSPLPAIAANLEDAGLIRSSAAFSLHVRLNGQAGLLRAGAYVLQPSMTAADIVQVLTGGATGEVSITIPEGFTAADIDRLMAEKGFTETGAIVACAKTCIFGRDDFLPMDSGGPGGRIEGYLFPDTYFVGGMASDPEAFLSLLLNTFERKVRDDLSADIAASGKSLEDVVIMASLIEEEAANDSERAIISGILWKRLDEGIILGVDAAVRYAVGKPPREPLTQGDLQIDSPYNIRVKRGLPPGPIANAGLASIKAALHPEPSPYYYYLHGKDGNIHYAVTNEEHNQNRDRYLR